MHSHQTTGEDIPFPWRAVQTTWSEIHPKLPETTEVSHWPTLGREGPGHREGGASTECQPPALSPKVPDTRSATVKGKRRKSEPMDRAALSCEEAGHPRMVRCCLQAGQLCQPVTGCSCLACAFCPVSLSGTLTICVLIYQQHILNCVFMAQCTFHS